MASEQSRLRYQRGQPRADVVTYRIRVNLKQTDPPTWRRLEVAFDLNLAEGVLFARASLGTWPK